MAKPPKSVRSYLTRLSRKAAKARMKKISPAERSKIARDAARARWARRPSA